MRAYAKVNLSINNLGKKGDFHMLDMIIAEIDLYDDIDIVINKNTKDIRVFGMNVENNIMCKAAKVFMKHSNIDCGLDIYINKKIPQEAGLGGGSSDAACVLKLLNELFETNLSVQDLLDMASEIGSDVSFFICGGICRCKGRGERVRQISKEKIKNMLILKPNFGLSTKKVFTESDAFEIISQEEKNNIIEDDILNHTFDPKKLFNDLEKAANIVCFKKSYNGIEFYKEVLIKCGATFAIMSGSGSTVVGFFDTTELLEKAYEKLKKEDYEVYKV